MSGYSFDRALDATTSAVWRPLDHALAQWVRAHGGSAALAMVAAWTSFADGCGDTTLPLLGDDAARHGMLPLSDAVVAALRVEALVGDGTSAQPTPFVLDADGRFALWRNHAHEVRIGEQIHARRTAVEPIDAAALADDLDHLFHADASTAVGDQRRAVANAVGRRLFVLTGGPGTGKTTTVLRILLMLQKRSPQPLTMLIAAPTGKAAQRLVQSLRTGKQAFSASGAMPLPPDWQPLLARIPDLAAPTVHRLLGYDPRRNVVTRGPANPLVADIVVIDEASMLDVGMLRALLDALPATATLILVGDADQLTSVAAGSVLMDLVATLEHERASECVRLRHSFRAEQRLAQINVAVRDGDNDAFTRAFVRAGAHAQRVNVDTPAALRQPLDRWSGELAAMPIRPLLAVPVGNADAEQRQRIESENIDQALAALHAFTQRQLLCALREEGFGALAVNHVIEQGLKRRWGITQDEMWYPGRAVLITRNDYATGLFNGDIGLTLADANGTLRVWFETLSDEARVGARAFTPRQLPPHDGAFAITIHKSQGSEYARVAVLLPPDREHRILSRQLLYTGLSRAKTAVELWATEAAVDTALAQTTRRAGGLLERLR